MTEKITLEKALELVSFKQYGDGSWGVFHVYCDVAGSVDGNVLGIVYENVGTVVGNVANVYGNVRNVGGNVGNVDGTINGRKWQFIETPRERLRRLIEENADKDQLLQAFNQLENNQ